MYRCRRKRRFGYLRRHTWGQRRAGYRRIGPGDPTMGRVGTIKPAYPGWQDAIPSRRVGQCRHGSRPGFRRHVGPRREHSPRYLGPGNGGPGNRSSREDVPRGWGTIEVRRSDGKSGIVELTAPSGSLENPLSGQQLEDKFRDCAAHALTPMGRPAGDEMIDIILNIEAIEDSRELAMLASQGAD